ncbi:MAG: glycosyl hydrolase 2 galactose-binding domain-containing protein [Bacteroidales bacterium]
MKRIFIIVLLLVCSTLFAQEQEKVEDNVIFFYNAKLSNGKNIKCENFDLDFHINTYDILESNGIIDSMFVRDNEKQLEDIDKMNWIYSCKFKVTRKQLSKDFAYLNIQNIDGNCSLYINNKFVKYYNNSFIYNCDDIKKFLKTGTNKIELRFFTKDSIRMNQRSPQYLYGWDWYPKTLAPRINGIWLTFEEDLPCIDYANIQTTKIMYNNNNSKTGEMILNVYFRKPLTEPHTLIVTNAEQEYEYAVGINDTLEFELYPNNTGYYTLEFTINNAELWYPNRTGEQYLYKVNICLDKISNVLHSTRFGIRRIDLIREQDSIGESFYFKVNNQNVFMKGANYIMTYDNPMNDIILAANANINMLRVWAGSDYGSDDFFNYCDEYGILVWQDYPFSTELYPVNNDFINNVKHEATQNIMRISGHPSLAVLCGNNEIWEGWNHWGWKEKVQDTIQVVKNYNYLFKDILKNISQKYAPTLDYIHSSPVNHGWGNQQSLTHGDCHYYGVWWADSNFETYTHKVPRFMSEYGFQSTMNPETALRYCSVPYTKENKEFAIHQKHPRGFELIDNRIYEWFGKYRDDEQYILFSQLTQQEGMKMAIETHRQHKPYCMGTLFWQYNDPYPCIGWGCIEKSSEIKPLYYTVQKTFEDVIFTIDKTDKDSVKVYVCSDLTKDTFLTYKLRIMNHNNSIHYIQIGEKLSMKSNAVQLLTSIAYKDIKEFNPNKDYMFIEGFYGDKFISNYTFFCYPKDYIQFDKYLEVIYDYYFEDDDD